VSRLKQATYEKSASLIMICLVVPFVLSSHLSCAVALRDRAVNRRFRLGLLIALAALVLLSMTPGVSGAACAPRPGSSGRWTLQSHDGISWLVTPCGERFFSIGINTVTDTSSSQLSSDLKKNSWLPPDNWKRRTAAQLGAWGFNTAGAFSSPNLPLPSLPDLELGRRARFHWSDPFDPSVEERMMTKAREAVAPDRGNAYRIGYFSDNEVGWWNGALFSYYLGQPGANHTKRKLVALIRRDYGGDWHRFTDDFVVAPGISSFQELLENRDARAQIRPGGSGIRVVRDWTGTVAQHYYELVHRALREANPAALIFGDRLPSYYDPDAVRAMAPFVDAVATNYNVDSPDGWLAHYYFDGLRQLTGNKPVLVSEWYFAAQENRSGNLNNGHLMTVRTQAERARSAASAARHFALEPGIVGIHWFQYYDEPKGGRVQDREDYNFGLVDTSGRPYEELVAALTAANRSLAEIHQSAAPQPPAKGTSGIQIPEADIDTHSPSLAQWPKDEALVKGLSAPSPEVVFGDVLLAWSAKGLHAATIGMDHYDAQLLAYDGEFPRAEAFRVDLGVDAGAGARRFAFFSIPSRGSSKNGGAAMRIEVCRMNHEVCDAVLSTVRGGSLTRYAITLPWEALGISGPPADRHLRIQLAATAFYRSHWMSLGGTPPAKAMEDLTTWKPATLTGRPGSFTRDELTWSSDGSDRRNLGMMQRLDILPAPNQPNGCVAEKTTH
jgi:hypothetical protein